MNLTRFYPYLTIGLFCFTVSCEDSGTKLFKVLGSRDTGISFNNVIQDNENFNILNYQYLYNGGGLGTGDFNNDGLQDLFFAGNMVSNQLYLNEGNLHFKDITDVAGVAAPDKWCTGVVVVDINEDGWDDIYVCAAFFYEPDKLRNLLFVNQGLNEDGIPVFREEASQYGIDDNGYSSSAAFFDYDLDGDLDLYVLTNQLEVRSPNNYNAKRVNGESPTNDRLYRNNGNGTFSNVTKEANILIEGYGLGVHIADFNSDGWPDIYVSNDFLSNDLLWINQKNGTFKNEIATIFKHQSHSAMGNDVADINNDGRLDVFTLEMLPPNNERRKRMQGGNLYSKYVNNEKLGFEYQYMRNTLQVNQGNAPDGLPRYGDLGMLADVYASDWSWATLLQDFDFDGDRDIFVSNGFPKDITDMDFIAFRASNLMVANRTTIFNHIPEVNIPNYYYRNDGNLKFEECSKSIGMDKDSYSNGAIYADLDNDGDLDIVTSNINQEVTVYENQINRQNSNNRLILRLRDSAKNKYGLGAKIHVYAEGKLLSYDEHTIYRGYMSTVDPRIFIGVGDKGGVDSIRIQWQDGSFQLIEKPALNEELMITKSVELQPKSDIPVNNYVFARSNDQLNVHFEHIDFPFVDFNIQRTIPFQLSQSGPSISVGDVNGDGLEDFYIGGSLNNGGTFYIQMKEGSFIPRYMEIDHMMPYEDLGTLLFDADNDGDLDLYCVSGSYENELSEANYSDRLYVNDGNGNFSRAQSPLQDAAVSGSVVRAADFDQDGDLDLFVGGRVQPGAYPKAVDSKILLNESEKDALKFTNVTSSIAPELLNFGLVTDALWTDVDNDNDADLMVLSEWSAPKLFINNTAKLERRKDLSDIDQYKGLWRSLNGADLDNDGDTDYILGNFGLNNEYRASLNTPMEIYYADFDKNGSIDPIITCFQKSVRGGLKSYPMHSKDDVILQYNGLKKKTLRYEEYANASIEKLLDPEELRMCNKMEVTELETLIFENLGIDESGRPKFDIHRLPQEVQIAPIHGIQFNDFNTDGLVDILMVGNEYGIELFAGRQDAFNGLMLINRGGFIFEAENYDRSGFLVSRDAKSLVAISVKSKLHFLVGQNQDSLLTYSYQTDAALFNPEEDASFVLIESAKNGTQKRELFKGSGGLSQTGRSMFLPSDWLSIRSFDIRGNELRSRKK